MPEESCNVYSISNEIPLIEIVNCVTVTFIINAMYPPPFLCRLCKVFYQNITFSSISSPTVQIWLQENSVFSQREIPCWKVNASIQTRRHIKHLIRIQKDFEEHLGKWKYQKLYLGVLILYWGRSYSLALISNQSRKRTAPNLKPTSRVGFIKRSCSRWPSVTVAIHIVPNWP